MGWPLAIYIDWGYSSNCCVHTFTKSSNHLVCSCFPFYYHQACVSLNFISCPYPWTRLPKGPAFTCNLVCGCGRLKAGTCLPLGVGQRVAHKGPFSFPITDGTRPGAGAGGGIYGREDADARSELMMSLFISDCFHSHTALTSSNVLSRTLPG